MSAVFAAAAAAFATATATECAMNVCVWGRMSCHCAELLEILWWVHLLVMVMVWYVHLVMCMQVQIRRFLIEYHIFIPTPVYARGLIILDEVAARVGGVSDKCAFVSHWRQATRPLVVVPAACCGAGVVWYEHVTVGLWISHQTPRPHTCASIRAWS
jgi:hypothetical protein